MSYQTDGGTLGFYVKRPPILAFLAIFASLSGCGLIRHKPASEAISINSEPPGATATVMGQTMMTPATINVPSDQSIAICVSAPGYVAQTVYDDTMAHWKYRHDCYPGEEDCTSTGEIVPTTMHVLTDVNVKLHPCPSGAGACPQCPG